MKQNETCALHDILHDIVERFGQDIIGETRIRGIVNDMLPEDIVSSRIMSRAVNDHLGAKLLSLRGLDDSDFELKLANIRQAFQEDNFLQHGIADYVVDCFLYSLEWIDEEPEYSEDETETAPRGILSFTECDDGTEYCGNKDKNDERSGFGVERTNTEYYAGEWKLDMRHGIGIEVDNAKNKYAGEWGINRRKGVGVEIAANGNKYVGEWKNGKACGPGILFLPGGIRICGLFENGKFLPGEGICYLKDGSYIIGRMTEDGPDGTCRHYYPEGGYEIEEWHTGQRCA